MKLRILLFALFSCLFLQKAFTQGANCPTSDPFCTGTTYTFPNSTSTADLGAINCCSTTPNPAWYFMELDAGGNMTIEVEQTDASGSGLDVDFVLFGPYSSLAAACTSIPGGPVEDCSYLTDAIEYVDITGGVVGEIYVLLLTNFSDDPGTITFSQTGGTASADCSLLCGVTGFTATPGACSPATNQYSVSGSLGITSPPATGTVTFTNSCGGTPVVVSAPFPASIPYTFSGLPSNGAGCTVSATFSADATCNSTVNYTAPAPCTTSCIINNFTANLTAPACGAVGGTYDISGVVQTTSAPATGTLTVSTSCGGSQVFNAPFAATINYTLTGLPANGAACTITAVYSAAPGCTQSIAYTAPTCPCNIDNMFVNIGACDGPTNTYAVDVDLDFSSPPASGTLDVTVCGVTQSLSAPFVSPVTVSFTGLPTGVGICSVTATFSASPGCTSSLTYPAPSDCSCPADAGTYTTVLTGSGTTSYVLCENDQVDITSNGDFTYPNDLADPAAAYNPGLWVLVYACPPTVGIDVIDDPCFLGVSPFTDDNGNMTDVNDMLMINSYPPGTFTNNTIYYVPITMYDVTTGTYSLYPPPNTCFDLGNPIAVTYLPPIVANGTEDCMAGTVTVTVSGGHPELFGTQFTASNLSPATASFVSSTCGNGGTIVIGGLANGDNYSFDITDVNGCPYTYSGGPFTGPASVTITPAGPFCSSDPAVNLTASTGGGTWTGTGITSASAGTFDPAVAGSGTHTITYQAPGCATPATINIVVGNIAINSVNTTNITCNGDNDGSIVINAPAANQFSIDGGISFQASSIFTGLGPGNYNIEVQSASGCSNTSTATITEPALLQLGINTFTNESCLGACNGEVAALPAGGTIPYSAVTWVGPVSGSGLSLSGACSGTYTASVTDANGCTASNTTIVTGPPPPAVTFSIDTNAGCIPLVVNFTNTMGPGVVATSNWDFGDGGSSSALNPLHVYNTAGCFDVTLTVQTTNGCTVDTTINNIACAYNNPVADFTFNPNPADVYNPLINFTNLTVGGTTYSWDFSGLGSSTATHPSFLFSNDSGSVYNVCLSTVSTEGCVDTTCHLVEIEDVFILYVPNTFTPDGDGKNDVFLPVLQGEDPPTYELLIFNRWGDLIFQSNNKLVGWDGTHNGMKAKEDVYVWKIRVRKAINQAKVEKRGHITLLR